MEQRCNELGTNCVCSEPFNTNVLPVVQTFWKNPADSTSKECSTAGSIAGGALESDNVSIIIPRNDSIMLNALPTAAQSFINWAVGGINDYLAIFFAGHSHNSSTFQKRLAARFYIYHSPNFEFAQDGVCTNSKLMQFTGPNSLLDKSFGAVHMYNFLASDGWSPGQDCCFDGPGSANVTKADWRGKWWRVEAIYTIDYCISNGTMVSSHA